MKRLFAFFLIATAAAAMWPATADAQVQVVIGDITEDMTWTRDTTYVLSGAVFVREPATLTIEAGTLIVGELATTGTLVIDQGAKINAIGTARRPIVFTSDQPVGERTRGSWGGLILNGRAPINVGPQAEGEGGTGVYGGTVADDNSGVLRYVRVEFAGIEFSPDNELNGIALQGVGSGTILEFLQVHMNLDDGIEFFGGTVNAKWLVLTWNADDSLDWTDGWTGSVQYVVIQQRGDDADQGIEADNNGENNNKSPRSNPTLYNLTIIGDPDSDEGDESDIGILLREGTAATIRNAIVVGFKEWGIVITQPATWKGVRNGDLSVANTMFFDNGGGLSRSVGTNNWDSGLEEGETFTTAEAMAGGVSEGFAHNVDGTDPRLRKPYNVTGKLVVRPRRNSPALESNGAIVAPAPVGSALIEDTDFLGAMGPRLKDDWTRKWTKRPQS